VSSTRYRKAEFSVYADRHDFLSPERSAQLRQVRPVIAGGGSGHKRLDILRAECATERLRCGSQRYGNTFGVVGGRLLRPGAGQLQAHVIIVTQIDYDLVRPCLE